MKIIHKKGDTLRLEIQAFDDEGNVINLTGFEINCQCRQNLNSEPIFDLSIGNGIEIIDAVNGIYEMTVEADDQTDWEFGIYKFDIEYIDSQGVIESTYPADELEVVPKYTRNV